MTSGLSLPGTLRRRLEKFCRLNAQDPTQLDHYFQPNPSIALLHLAHIGPVDLCLKGKVFLRNALLMPNSAQVGSKDLAIVHTDSQRPCRLQTHRFKETLFSSKPVTWAFG